MTSAILNDLAQKNSQLSFDDVKSKSNDNCFAKIFDFAKNKSDSEPKDVLSENNASENNNQSNENNSLQLLNPSGNESTEDKNNSENKELSEISAATKITICGDEADVEETESSENTYIIISEETNITEEEENMQKELNTLEDPAITMLLHAQIKQNTKISVETENVNDDTNAENNTVLSSNKEDKTIFKTFENTQPKDINLTASTKLDTDVKPEVSKNNSSLNEKVVKDLNIESVNSESVSDNNSGDLMQNQTPQEQAVKVMIQGDIKFDNNYANIKVPEARPTEISPSKIIEQISKQIEGMYNNSKLNIVLNPGTLGRVNLHILNTSEGLVAQFTVTTQEARDILLKGINGLKECLIAQGITIDNLSVKLEDAEGEYQPDWTEQDGSKGGYNQQNARKQKNQEKPFEQMMFEIENNDNLEITG